MRWRIVPESKELGWTPYAWLIYLPTLLIEPYFRVRTGSASDGYLTFTALGTLAFLALYFRGYWVRGAALSRITVMIAALGVIFAPFNAGFAVLFVYAGSFAGQLDDSRSAWRHIVLITLLTIVTCIWVDAELFSWLTGVFITPLIGSINLHYARYSRSQKQLRIAQDQVTQLAAVAERERIARDLHDVLGHTLSLIALKSELAVRLAERDPPRAAAEMSAVHTIARTALQEVRETIRGYHPTIAEELERAQTMLDAAGIATEVRSAHIELPTATEESLAFALREAVTNVARHSGATRCRIMLASENDAALLRVTDDGRGGNIMEGTGMRGMRDRVEALGGSMTARSEGGFLLEVRVPIDPGVEAARLEVVS